MCNSAFKVLLVMAALIIPLIANAQLSDEQVQALIVKADHYRLEQRDARVLSVVHLYQNEQLEKVRRYHVYTRPERRSLVIFKSVAEQGQKLLMLGDNYWLQMPHSRRAIRITPMQKLLGEASVGDIATLTWEEDYRGEWLANDEVKDSSGQLVPAYTIRLTNITKSASYQRIDLWLRQSDAFPLQADFYLRSGKLAKQARFTQGMRNGHKKVVAMTLLDTIQKNRKTVINYQSITQWSLPDKYFQPNFLLRLDANEL